MGSITTEDLKDALACGSSPELREAGAHAIHAFSAETNAAQELASNGALSLLQSAAVKQPNSLIIQQAFEKLLEFNLSVKYKKWLKYYKITL